MKKTCLCIALFIPMTAPFASAQEAGICEQAGNIAEVIMMARQEGVPLSQVVKIAKESFNEEKAVVDMAVLAYEQPRYSSAAVKQQTIQDFRNNVELACYKR
ncbi:MAG: hypothetical protein AAF755_05730 [Pseudomonadota bacterium]